MHARLMRLRLSRVEKKLQVHTYVQASSPRRPEYYTRVIIILGIHVNKHLFERFVFLSPSSAAKRILLCLRRRGRLVQDMLQSRSCSVERLLSKQIILFDLLSCIKNGKKC